MSPRKAIVKDIQEVNRTEYDSNILKVRRALEHALGPDVHVHLANPTAQSGTRLAQLSIGTPRVTALRWSKLTPKQREAVEEFLPYMGTDDLIRWGDTVAVVCSQTEWDADQQRKGQIARKAAGQDVVESQFRRESGVSADTAWSELGPQYTPRSSG